MKRILIAAGTVAVAAVAVVPASASAATITPSAQCFESVFSGGQLTYQPITGTITGGTPGGSFQIFGVDGEASGVTGNFDAAGNAPFAIRSFGTRGIRPSGGQKVELQVREFGGAGAVRVTASTTVLKTNRAAYVNYSKPRRPTARRQISFSGTAFAGQRIYAIVTNRNGRKTVKRSYLGKANACGFVSTKKSLIRSNRDRKYDLYFSASKKLTKSRSFKTKFSVS